MADQVVLTESIPEIENWDVEDGTRHPYDFVPRGQLLYAGSELLPEKIGGDTLRWTLSMLLPRNFVYRAVELRIWIDAALVATIDDQESSVLAAFTPVGGGKVWHTELEGGLAFTSGGGSMPVHRFYVPRGAGFSDPLVVDAPGGTITTHVNNAESDPTEEFTGRWYCRVLIYDITQFTHAPVHTPSPIIGP